LEQVQRSCFEEAWKIEELSSDGRIFERIGVDTTAPISVRR